MEKRIELSIERTIKERVRASGIDINIFSSDFKNDYASLNEIARYRNEEVDPLFVIQNWMREKSTIEFLALWEELHNPKFDRSRVEPIMDEAGSNCFVMTPAKWIAASDAVGIISRTGRYGGIYAHSDIAMAFTAWLSPEFVLYIMKDYQRFKINKTRRQPLPWNLSREVVRLKHDMHASVMKGNVEPEELTQRQLLYDYVNDADMLNVILFGKTERQWRGENPKLKGNIRDYATIHQSIILLNLESYNDLMKEYGKPQEERMQILHRLAVQQIRAIASMAPDEPQEDSGTPEGS